MLRCEGLKYTFTLMKDDEYRQPVESDETVTITGIYHEKNSFIKLETSEDASVQRKKSPMILTLLDDEVRKISQGYKVKINGVTYKVAGLLDIQNYGVAVDISLEVEV